MAVQNRDLYIDLAQKLLVNGPATGAPLNTLSFIQGDTVRLVLHGLEAETVRPSVDFYRPSSIQWATLRAGITLIDALPKGGTHKLKVGADTTPALSATETKASLSTKLNALASIIAAGGLTLETTGAENIYRAQWTVPANAIEIESVENKLTPLSIVRIAEDGAIDGKVNIKIFQAPVAYTDDFSLPAPPPVTVARTRAGSSIRNEVQRLTIPSDAVGGFASTVGGFSTKIVQVATATAATIAAALNEPFTSVLASDIRFSVTNPSRGIFDVEFIGAYEKASQSLLSISMFDQVAIDTPVALLPLTSLAIEDLLDGAPSVKAVFEIVAADEDGRETTLVQKECVILNDGLDAGVGTFIDQIATRIETVTVYPAETDPVVIARMGQAFNVPGDADDEITATDYTFVHGFGTTQVDVVILRLTDVALDQWEPLDEGEYQWKAISANAVEVWFAAEPPASGVGSIRLWVSTLNATPQINDHRHETDDIDGVGDDDGKTLTEIISELRSSLPTDWPFIPANKLTGTIDLARLDLAALAKALQTTPEFLTALRELVKDTTVLDNIATGLATRESFLETLKTLIADPALITALMAALKLNADFLAAIRAGTLDALQGTGVLPNGAVVMVIPDKIESFPPLLSTATDPDPEFSSLLGALHTTTDLGTVEGELPSPGSNGGKRATIGAAGAHASTAGQWRGQDFKAGDVVACNGVQWFLGTLDGATVFPKAFERELFTIRIDEDELALGTRFAVAWPLALKLRGNAEGQYVLRLWLGTVNAASGTNVRPNISTISWDSTPLITRTIIVTDVEVIQGFAYTVTRAAGGTITATKTINSATSSATAPGSANFALRATLDRFDVEDVTDPRGEVSIRMTAAKASIVTA